LKDLETQIMPADPEGEKDLTDAFLAGRLLDASRVSWRHCSSLSAFECCVSSSSFSCWQVISPNSHALQDVESALREQQCEMAEMRSKLLRKENSCMKPEHTSILYGSGVV
jgi:hypothetical protein